MSWRESSGAGVGRRSFEGLGRVIHWGVGRQTPMMNSGGRGGSRGKGNGRRKETENRREKRCK